MSIFSTSKSHPEDSVELTTDSTISFLTLGLN